MSDEKDPELEDEELEEEELELEELLGAWRTWLISPWNWSSG